MAARILARLTCLDCHLPTHLVEAELWALTFCSFNCWICY